MHPYLFEIPLPWGASFRAPSYGFMMATGFLVCLYLLTRRARRMGLDPSALFDMATAALIGGLVGARVFYLIQNWGEFASDPWSFFYFWRGGLTFYGGLLGGAAAALLVVRRKRLPVRASLDVAASLLPLGHAFGRVGCFLQGCCFGKATASWAGVRFPRMLADGFSNELMLNADGRHVTGSPAFLQQVLEGWPRDAFQRLTASASGQLQEEFRQATALAGDGYHLRSTSAWSLPVHPTQIYEVAYNLLIFAALSYLLRRRRRAGDVAWAYGMLYGSARFANEFLRADTALSGTVGGLTVFQVLSLGAAAFGLVMLLDSLRRPRQPLPELWQPPPEARKKRQAPMR